MADRVNFYFRQRVSEAELDLAFALLERADRNLAADLGIYGVVSGAVPAPHAPVPDLSVDLTAPARAYDALGQRLFFGTGQTVDCSVDLVGIPTEVTTADHERWLGIFLRFGRQLSDPRTDGNSQQVFFRSEESFELVVRQAPEGPIAAAPKPALQPDELLLCDVRRSAGQTQILSTDIDESRRQAFLFARGTSVSVVTGAWNVLAPLAATAQSAFDEVDAELLAHFSGDRRHPAAAIDYAPRGFLAAATVQDALDEMVNDLTSTTTAASGATRIGVDAVAGAPNALATGTVKSQLAALLGWLNGHLGAVAGAHNASSVAATPHNQISASNVQAQLQEIVTDLRATTPGASGASLVGIEPLAGIPAQIGAGPLTAALASLLASINAHQNQPTGAHAASAVAIADAGSNFTAATVEAALTEGVDAFAGSHFRGNEANAGMHRSIRQPPLGGSKALVLDSFASGNNASRFRIYADTTSIWFTVNAAWTDPGWTRDAGVFPSAAIRLSVTEVKFLHHGTLGATFADWTHSWKIPMGESLAALEVSGPISNAGRLGMQWSNANTVPQILSSGGAVTFRSRMTATPSSITLGVNSASPGFVGAPTVSLADRNGFVYVMTQNLPGLATAWWYGFYLAIA